MSGDDDALIAISGDHRWLSDEPCWLMVGQRRYPVKETCFETWDTTPKTHRRQAVLMFESRYQLSVVWGSMTYSDNHEHPFDRTEFSEAVRVVEIAVIDDDGLVGDPIGYVDAHKLNEIIKRLNDGVLPSEIGILS